MYETLISNLKEVYTKYERGINLTEKIFNSLKLNDIRSLPFLTAAQTECMTEIKIEKEKLREFVKGVITKFNIDSSDYRVQHILYLFSQKQKENIIDLSREIRNLELLLERALYRNQELLVSIMSAAEAFMEAAIDYNENEHNESQLFLDEKF